MKNTTEKYKKDSNINWGVTIICAVLVLALGAVAVINPDGTKNVLNSIRDFTLFEIGSGFLWYTFGATIFLGYLTFSKYGKIRLGGKEKPTFNKFKLFAMALSAGMGASTMYWAFIESAHYVADPQFGIVDKHMNMEYATAFNMYHWGPIGWILYLTSAIPFIIVFYIKKEKVLSFSGVMNSLFGNKIPLLGQKFLDLIFILTTLGATALTLGLGIPMISSVISTLTGVPDTVTLGVGIVVALAIIFALSSYIGMEKGMANLSSATIYICAVFVAIIFLIGPMGLILNNVTNSVGVVITDFFRITLNTDPFGDTGFPQFWTIFFIANWISYAPGMGIFITKIAKGHTLKDVVLILTIGGSIGTFLIFGVAGTYTLDLMNTGELDVLSYIQNGQPQLLLNDIMQTTPIPTILLIIYAVAMILFTVTTLDGTSYSLASVASKKVNKNGDVSPMFRLFWSILLAVIPTIFLIIKADLNIIKSFPIIIVVPMIPIFIIGAYKSFLEIKKKFGHMDIKEIEDYE